MSEPVIMFDLHKSLDFIPWVTLYLLSPGNIVSMMWNLHQHYAQFVPAVQAYIARHRQPIEKELKV